jgi:hypothetical protein
MHAAYFWKKIVRFIWDFGCDVYVAEFPIKNILVVIDNI